MKIAVVSGLGSVWGPYRPNVLDVDSGSSASGSTVGGGEAAMLRTSFGLAALGHEVDAFIPLAKMSGAYGDESDEYNGVRFRHLNDAYRALFTEPFDALCSWSDVKAIVLAPPAMRRVYVQQLNDMPEHVAFWRAVDAIVPASATHGRYLSQFAPSGASVLYQPLYGGVMPALYKDALAWPMRKPVVSWWSSPDRGLHHLLAIWPRIRAEVPYAELRIAYHMWRYIDGTRTMFHAPELPYRARTLETNFFAAQRAGGVHVLGPISRTALAVHQGETKVLAQMLDPMVPTEGLGVSVSEGIAAGCWCVVRSDDAFREVYDGYVQWVDTSVPDDSWRARFAAAVVHALKSTVNPYEARAAEFARSFTWEQAARALERACQAAPKRPDHKLGFGQSM